MAKIIYAKNNAQVHNLIVNFLIVKIMKECVRSASVNQHQLVDLAALFFILKELEKQMLLNRLFGHTLKPESQFKADHAPKPEPQFKADHAPKPEPQFKADHAPKPEPQFKADHAPKPEPQFKADHAPKPEPQSKPNYAPKPEPKFNPNDSSRKRDEAKANENSVLFDAQKILGIKEGATQAEIDKARREKARQFHPDKNPGREKEATEEMQKVNNAYDLLSKNASNNAGCSSRPFEAAHTHPRKNNDTQHNPSPHN